MKIDLDEADFQFLRKMVVQRAGVLIPRDQPAYVAMRLDPILDEQDLIDLAELCDVLREVGAESPLGRRVIESLLRTDTFFFRNYSAFDYMRHKAIPALIKSKGEDRTLRIWCAACSSGQEAYSIAVMIREALPEIADWEVTILGTDLSASLIERAKTGIYTQEEIENGLPRSIGMRNFKQIGNKWIVREEHRNAVEFRTFNLMGTWDKLPSFDIILMRNVLVYFQASAKQSVVRQLKEIMHPGSYVFLGSDEELNKTEFTKVRGTEASVYKTKAGDSIDGAPPFEFDERVGEETITDIDAMKPAAEKKIRRLTFMKGVELSIAGPEFRRLSQIAGNTYLFKGMSIDEIEKACRQIGLYQYDDKQVILEQGQPGENFYIIFEGKARVLVSKGVFRKKEEVAVLKGGDLFGEMSLILNQPCNATVVAIGRVKVFVGKKGVFDYLCRESDTFASTLESLIRARAATSEGDGFIEFNTPRKDNRELTYVSKERRRVNIEKEDGAKLLRLLKNNYLFRNLKVLDLDRICNEVQLHEYPPGDILLKQGYRGAGFYILYQGVVGVMVSPNDSDDYRTEGTEVAQLKSQEIFGEMSIILDSPCNATIVTKNTVLAFIINYELFEYLMDHNQAFADNINTIVIERVTDNDSNDSNESNESKDSKD